MGLIKAGLGALGGTLADQWKEYFTCEALESDVLVVKGQKRVNGRSSNTKGTDNIISSGSVIAVADGQCMLIVEQGKVVEVCAEPGEFVYDASTEPSIFAGGLGEGIKNTFKSIGKRFTFGGEPPKDQRVYYINTKELMDNKFGTPNPVPFRVVDSKVGFDMDVSLRCSGVYSYRIADPLLFYTKVCGNVQQAYTRDQIESQLKTEFISALQPTFATLSDLELRPNQIIQHNIEMEEAMNKALSEKWGTMRGLKVVSIALGSVTLSPEDTAMLKQAQQAAYLSRPDIAAGTMVGASVDILKTAAGNSGGAMTGFMGMGMAMNASGMNTQNMFAMSEEYKAKQAAKEAEAQQAAAAAAAVSKAPAADEWKCPICGAMGTGKFCTECGAPKPVAIGWTCSCGSVNKGKFCPNCGAKKPADAPLYKCDKCGWEPEDPKNPPRFCPECGDPFNDGDIQ